MFAAYGSKLRAVVKQIQEIKSRDAKAKILVFVQWESLRKKILAAFLEFGVNSVSLEGTIQRRNRVIKNFEQPCDEEGNSAIAL